MGHLRHVSVTSPDTRALLARLPSTPTAFLTVLHPLNSWMPILAHLLGHTTPHYQPARSILPRTGSVHLYSQWL